ncbi:MAG TPA: autotransporter outer membrane beta-barrel domain-containing protein, partial [Asticcacaulis sp.]|nr:autotransporter outer membrane beta-barrel domain-containing protein [Asticcacaulis sp.]
MRKHLLLSATALGLILSGLMVLPAAADTSISSSITTPTKTSDTGNLTVDVSAQITLTSGTAITVNSDNTVTLNGAIVMAASADNSTAILVDAGHTSGLTISNNITVTDDFTATDTLPTGALDGIADYPYAQGTGRYGVHSVGATPFNGNVTFNSPSIMQIEGNNSYGFRFENQLNGNFSSTGTINMVGDGNTAISLEKGVTGNVLVGGNINLLGKDARAVNLNGDIAGSLEVEAAITNTAYATVTPTSLLTPAQIAALPPVDVQQAGPLMTVSGNVAKGILINTVPATDSTNTSTDQDGDGITDTSQTTATLSQYGSAPALLIASSTAPITIGGVVYNSSAVNPPAVNYGLLMRGSILSNGLYPNVGAVGVQIGGLGQTVTIANGIGVAGQITAVGSNGDVFGLLLKSGASTPQLDILSVGIGASTTTASLEKGAYGVDINAGASLPTINIKAGGGIAATGTGSTSASVAIRDQSNTLTTINTSGAITSVRTATDDNDDGFLDKILHPAVAIDTHTNTVGLNLTMIDSAPTDDTIVAPTIKGDILLGSGNDHISFNGGAMIGDIDFGGGANSFILDGGALYSGKLTGTGTVNLDLIKGETDLTAAGQTLNLTNLHVGAESTLAITADTEHPTTPVFTVAGNAVFDNGAKLDVQLNSMLLTPQTFTLITATNLNLGTINSDL